MNNIKKYVLNSTTLTVKKPFNEFKEIAVPKNYVI